jgi:ferredoxin
MNELNALIREATANASLAADRRDWMQPTPHRRAWTLTATPGLRTLLRGRWFLGTLRWLTGLLLVLGIHAALFQPTKHGAFALALFWGLFWPFFTALVTPTIGNAFCAVCPHGAMGRWLTPRGLKRRIPAWAKRLHLGLGLLLLTYWVGAYAMPGGFARAPVLTGWLFLGWTAVAAVMFLVFRDMAHCRTLCPLGNVLTATARASSLWITTDKRDCASCRSFDCAKACAWALKPFRFEAENTMRDCTLCMACVQACPSAKVEARAPGHQFRRPVTRVNANDAWALLAITAVAAIGIQFLHGLNHTPWKAAMPWNTAAPWFAATFGQPQGFAWSGLLALLLGVGLTLAVALPAYAAAARVAGTSRGEAFAVLAPGQAPLACIAMLSHTLVFFLVFHASGFVNEGVKLAGLGLAPLAPLADRRDAWLKIFEIFPCIAVAWALWATWRRAQVLLPAGSGRQRVAVWALAAAPIWLYVLVYALKIVAFASGAGPGHHH